MLKLVNDQWHGEYIIFSLDIRPENRKTDVWQIYSKNVEIENESNRFTRQKTPIGFVKWFGRWRRYCFFPMVCTVYEQKCLGDIAEFIEARTKEHKTVGKCQKCGKNRARKDHSCSYLSDLNGDTTTKCNCCTECIALCCDEL
jgi:hypothetical protein